MDRLIRNLVARLAAKGMELSTIPAFIRNLANSIAANPYISLYELNRQMNLLGWGDIEIDDYTLQLTTAALESGFDAEPTHRLEMTHDMDIFHKPSHG